jgi:hypothetical protein
MHHAQFLVATGAAYRELCKQEGGCSRSANPAVAFRHQAVDQRRAYREGRGDLVCRKKTLEFDVGINAPNSNVCYHFAANHGLAHDHKRDREHGRTGIAFYVWTQESRQTRGGSENLHLGPAARPRVSAARSTSYLPSVDILRQGKPSLF